MDFKVTELEQLSTAYPVSEEDLIAIYTFFDHNRGWLDEVNIGLKTNLGHPQFEWCSIQLTKCLNILVNSGDSRFGQLFFMVINSCEFITLIDFDYHHLCELGGVTAKGKYWLDFQDYAKKGHHQDPFKKIRINTLTYDMLTDLVRWDSIQAMEVYSNITYLNDGWEPEFKVIAYNQLANLGIYSEIGTVYIALGAKSYTNLELFGVYGVEPLITFLRHFGRRFSGYSQQDFSDLEKMMLRNYQVTKTPMIYDFYMNKWGDLSDWKRREYKLHGWPFTIEKSPYNDCHYLYIPINDLKTSYEVGIPEQYEFLQNLVIEFGEGSLGSIPNLSIKGNELLEFIDGRLMMEGAELLKEEIEKVELEKLF